MFFKNTTYLSSTNTYFQNMTSQRANTLIHDCHICHKFNTTILGFHHIATIMLTLSTCTTAPDTVKAQLEHRTSIGIKCLIGIDHFSFLNLFCLDWPSKEVFPEFDWSFHRPPGLSIQDISSLHSSGQGSRAEPFTSCRTAWRWPNAKSWLTPTWTHSGMP